MASSAESDALERTSSQLSTASRRSGIARAASRKQSTVTTPDTAKTLESFPSLSPDASPSARHARLVSSPPLNSPTGSTPKATKKEPSMVESLVQRTKSSTGRTALFDDGPKMEANGAPGSLHHASDDHIRRLVRKTGAVSLVRQLASDLAERDTELTSFRRRAEERERELKKMLTEVEVSNMDIETRLHRIEHKLDTGTNTTSTSQSPMQRTLSSKTSSKASAVINGLENRMGEAMKDDVGALEIDEGYLDSIADSERQATVKAKKAPSKGSDASSVDSQAKNQGTSRGWKDYLLGSAVTSRKTSKASSVISDPEDENGAAIDTRGHGGSTARRKGLDNDLFNPPVRSGTDGEVAKRKSQSRKSTSSIASWTTKLFAGNPTGARETDNEGTVRGRSNTASSDQTKVTKPGPTASGQTPRSAKAALMRVSSMENSRLQSKKSAQPLTINPKAAPKGTIPPVPPLPQSPTKANAAANLGPVEMDTIHPPDSKPPTLIQSDDKTTDDVLTDRYGFIYDQRRRRREAEAVMSHKRGKSNVSANIEMINSARASMKSPEPDQVSKLSGRPDTPPSNEDNGEDKPVKKWQDYLKVATVPTELLLHTPSPKPGLNVISADVPSPPVKRMPTNGDGRTSLPVMSSNAEPEISPVTAGKAEMSKSALTKALSESTPTIVEDEPVKLLLAQLTELHDSLQREKNVKWNEFLRKVRAERKKEGEMAAANEGRSQQTAMPEMMLTDGEMIGVSGLGNKGKVGRAKWKEFKQLVVGGIPVAYRAKIWAECSGATALRVPGYYDDLVRSGGDDPVVVSQIQMDIHRTLTDNIFFRRGPGVAKLNEVLLAYSRRNPEVGYCQGMNLIAASLLLIMPTAEDAFWVLTSLIENILPQHYYDPSLLASRADQQVLRSYVTEILPKLSAHLDSLGIELDALTFQWFLSVFTDCLSAEALFRVWDVIFCFNDGSTFLFQVGLALLKLNESRLLECDSAARVYGYIGNEMTDHAISIDGLVGASEALKNVVTRREVEERRWRAVEDARERERKGRVREKERDRDRDRDKGSDRAGSKASSGELSLQEPRPVDDGVG